MEHSNKNADMLEKLIHPAFTVTDGKITQANQAAIQRGIQLNTAVTDLITIGSEEYQQFTDGKLCITLSVQDIPYQTTVSICADAHLFCLTSDYENPELRAFALAAQQLRGPLGNAMISAEQLMPNNALQEDTNAKEQLAQLNRSLHQLLRTISNMSDAASYTNHQANLQKTYDLCGIFAEILEKASSLASQANRTLNYSIPNHSVYGLADAEKLERAILNLISNAIKYTPAGDAVNATLRHSGNKLFFTLQDGCSGTDSQVKSNIFDRFLREPGLDDSRSGIGLGMSIVRSVAAAHGGTVLVEQPENEGARLTMTIAINQTNSNSIRTPVMLPVDYAGGRDHCLLELSDVLPASLYE